MTVSVYPGSATTGTPLRKVEAQVEATEAGAKPWSSVAIPALASSPGKYTVVARQTSAIGNGEGKAIATFFVDPGLPTLSLGAVAAQTNTSTPTFSGTSDQGKPVTVRISHRKATAIACEVEGDVVATAVATHGGAWSTAPASPALADGDYAAIAYQPGSSGTGEAATAAACFSLDTQPPAVSVSSPTSGAVIHGGTVEAHGGAGLAAHDRSQVTVLVLEGTGAPGARVVQQVSVNRAGAGWDATFSGLAPAAYALRAEQSDDAGNLGQSATVPFTVAGTTAAGPSAAFSWYPSKPHISEKVTLVSNSTGGTTPITGYAWGLDSPAFTTGAQTLTTSFKTAGSHTVRLMVTDSGGMTGVATQAIPVSYPLMRPFPVVRITTIRSHRRVRVKLLSAQAPPGASIEVLCSGKPCPVHSQLRKVPSVKKAAVGPLTFTRFERSFPPGVSLRIRVFAPGVVGKYTTFSIRRGKLPLRSDACVNAREPRPVVCPS